MHSTSGLQRWSRSYCCPGRLAAVRSSAQRERWKLGNEAVFASEAKQSISRPSKLRLLRWLRSSQMQELRRRFGGMPSVSHG
jgi:hypothetical protein